MTALDTFPISYKVAGRRIVVIGGGAAALAKTRLALKTSAAVGVWARSFDAGFDELESGLLTLNLREQGLEHHLAGTHWLDDVALVFIADDGADAAFAETEARAQGIPVNVVDKPARCDFYTPAIVDRAPISVAIASEGAAPVIARRVRSAIETVLPPELGPLAALAGSLRDEVAVLLPEGAPRRRYYERLAESEDIAARVSADPDAAREAARELLRAAAAATEPGAIAWVGAGPGAEDLLTLRAVRLLQSADIIAHETGLPDALIEMGRRDADRHVLSADSAADRARIASELVELARDGKRVVRLVSGDARDAAGICEEVAIARRAGIFVSVVPGVGIDLAEAGLLAVLGDQAKKVA